MPLDMRPTEEIEAVDPVILQNQKIRRILARARAIISDRKHWTTRATARNVRGAPVQTISEEAVSFCAIGAINRATWDLYRDNSRFGSLQSQAEMALTGGKYNIVRVNDNQGHSYVLKRFDTWLKKNPE